MKIIITGAGGFLGKELLKQLAGNNDIQVIALTSKQEILKNLYQSTSNIYIKGREYLFNQEHQMENIDILINCAFPRNVDGIQMAEGLLYIQQVIEAAVDMEVGAVINISSQSVYSQLRTEPATEDTVLNLESKYAVGKYTTELLTNSICKNIPHTNLRMASLIGPEFDQRVTNKMAKAAITNRKITIQEGQQYFGFLDVEDAARGIIKLATSNPLIWSENYNLGIDQAYTLRDIAECIANSYMRLNNADLEIVCQPADTVCNTALNCQKIEAEIGVKSTISLQESIDKIMADTFL